MTRSPLPRVSASVTPRPARFTTILLVARVSTDTRDDLCRVRNVSPGGMRIETLAPIDIGQHVEVELKNGSKVRSQVVWVAPAEAGVRFEAPVDVAELLASPERSRSPGGVRMMRSPRLSARCPVTLRHEGKLHGAVLTDISQGGAQLCCKATVKDADQLVLFVPGLGTHYAAVRWARDGAVGLAFDEKLGFAELSQWLASPDRYILQSAPTPLVEDEAGLSPIRRNS